MKIQYIIGLILLLSGCSKKGCTDKKAFNYDDGKNIATDNDLCEYVNMTKIISYGEINTDVVWEKVPGASIDYYVQDLLQINPGATLTIKPGVVVAFENSYYVGISVNGGTLLANGTASERITFTSFEDDGWTGIEVQTAGSTKLELSHVDITNAYNTVYCTGGCSIVFKNSGLSTLVTLDDVKIDASLFNVACGVHFYNVTQFNNATITNLTTKGATNDACY